MIKKSNVNISPIVVIRVIVFILIAVIVFSIYRRTVDFLTTSPMFAVSNVLVDSSIQFIDMRGLKQLKGRNIFRIDIKKIERQIASQYPQISQLRVEREFPDHIKVLARKRDPIAQIALYNKYLVLDTEGVALYYVAQPLPVPALYGIAVDRRRVTLGLALPTRQLGPLLEIINDFKERPHLSKLNIAFMQGGNLSKIDLTLKDNVHIIIDGDQTSSKIDMLETLLMQNRVDFNQVKYIDIRFKEPIIADNIDDAKVKG